MALFKKRPKFPVEVTGVLVNPQNVQFWDEPWCLLNALAASGVPASVDGDPGCWTFHAQDVQRSGNIYLTLIKSPSGNVWEVKWAIERGEFVRYNFVPHSPDSPAAGDEAAQLATCCDRRGGCL